jgi:hypothetical protein
MIVHIQDEKSPKQAWDTLVKMYSTNTQARKMQLKQELHNLQKNKMNISDYSTKVKNLADALASIGAPVDDEDLVVVTLNGLGKNYSQFRISIVVRETFPNFQDLITLLTSEDMRVVGTSSNGKSQESAFYSNSNRSRSRGVKTSFRGRHGSSHGGHHQHEGQSHGGGRGNFRGRGSRGGHGEVNNKIVIQIVTIAGNLGTWQKTIIKGSMMHEMESYNKGIMHQLAIKVMNNCL